MTRARKGIQELTLKRRYQHTYQEGTGDGRAGRTALSSEGMADTDTLRQERAFLACRRMVPGEQKV